MKKNIYADLACFNYKYFYNNFLKNDIFLKLTRQTSYDTCVGLSGKNDLLMTWIHDLYKT